MATNATTWFYQEPEHRAYYIEERVNHTLWSNRVTGVYLDCVSEEPPFRMEGTWQESPLELEWVPNTYLRLSAARDQDVERLVAGFKAVLGFAPTISYIDGSARHHLEWHVSPADERIRDIQASPHFREIKRHRA